MKARPYSYHRARRLEDALELLDEHGDEAKVLAGGLSLAPMMNLRLASPAHLVDVNRVAGLDAVVRDGDGRLRVGALARHDALHRGLPAQVRAEQPLLGLAGGWIGHLPIRLRGTVGGSLAHSDPTAEWCVCARLLDAELRVVSLHGERTIAAEDWFHGVFETDLRPDEMLVEVVFGRPRPHAGFAEYAQRRGDFGIVVAGAALDLDEGGVIADPRLVLGGVAGVPLAMPEVAAALAGQRADEELVVHAGALAGAALPGRGGAAGDAGYQRRLTASLTTVALAQAAGLATDRHRPLGNEAARRLTEEAA